MASILTDLGGFTPVLDIITQDVGHTTSLVYGLVWRHCQMRDGVCKKSVKELAEMLDTSDRTVRRHLKKLVDRGYIKDLTPDLRNRPHVYADSGKVKINGKIEVALDESYYDKMSDHIELGMTKSQGHYDNLSGQVGQIVRATMTKSPMSKTSKTLEETGRENNAPPISSKPVEDIPWQAVVTYTEITGLKLDRVQGKAIIQLAETPDFNLARWTMACTTTKLAGVLPANIACRIDVYKAGGNYQAMKERKRNGQPDTPAPSPVQLDNGKLAAYAALRAETEAAQAESAARLNEVMAGDITAAGIDIQKQIRKGTRKIK